MKINGREQMVHYIIMERCLDESLADVVQYTGALDEESASFVFYQLWLAMDAIHQNEWWHLDLKLPNLLFDKSMDLKLIDFGSALMVKPTNGVVDSKRGTEVYMAPEVLTLMPDQTYDAYKADVYWLGVCLYAMLTGELPKQQANNGKWILLEETDDSNEIWTNSGKTMPEVLSIPETLSEEAQILLESWLSLDPTLRPTVKEILEESWLEALIGKSFSYILFSTSI
jgi:serine/threonine protein kinase